MFHILMNIGPQNII